MKFSTQRLSAAAHKHMLAIVVGVTIALIVISPHIRAWYSIGPENFEGVYPTFHDDEITYQARIKEVQEGNFNIGNPYIKEHKDDPFIMPPVAEGLLAFVAFITHTSVPFVTSVSDFPLTLIAFALVYIFFLELTKRNRMVSLIYTTLFFIFSLSTFGRPISPQLNALFLFLGLIATVRTFYALPSVQKKMNLIAGGVAGITCFISPYYFTALLAFYGSLIMFEVVSEHSFDALKKKAIWFFIAFTPFALLYAFFHLEAASGLFYEATMLRYGVMHTHIPGSFTNMMFGFITLAVLVSAWKFMSRREFVFSLSAVFSIFILNWQNIITGTSLQFSSHYLFTTILFILMTLSVIHSSLIGHNGKLPQWMRYTTIVGVVLILLIVGENQKNEFIHIGKMPYSENELLAMQGKRAVFDWFNLNTEEDSVVYTLGGQYDFLLPVYTKNRVYYNFYAALYPASDTETEGRWLRQQLFNAEVSTTSIRDRQREFWGNKFIDTYQSGENRKKIISKLTGEVYTPGVMIAEESIDRMYTKWKTLQGQPTHDALSTYEIDYIMLSEDYPDYAYALTKLEAMDSVTLISTVGQNRVYRFSGE